MGRKYAYCALISLVLVLPFIYSKGLYNGEISAKQIWFYATIALLSGILGIDLLFRKKIVLQKFNKIDISLLGFYAWFFFRAAFTPYTPLLYNVRFTNFTLLLLLYFIVKQTLSSPDTLKESAGGVSENSALDNREIIPRESLLLILMLSGLTQALWGLLQLYGFLPGFHSGYKITGTFFNPAPYALYLAAIFPLALGNLLRMKDNRKTLLHEITFYVSTATVLTIILVLPATLNRASWLGAMAGSFLALNYRYNFIKRSRECLNSSFRNMLAFSALILLAASLAAGLYFLKKGSSDGRLFIWEVTAGKIAEKPLAGYGVGRFEAEYNNWQAEYFQNHPEDMKGTKGMVAGNTKYCFNEYLEMASEIGIFGLLLFALIILSVFREMKNRKTNLPCNVSNDDNPIIPAILIPPLLSLLVCGGVSFPFYSLPTLTVFVLLLAIISSQVKTDTTSLKNRKLPRYNVIGKTFLSLVLISVSVSLFLLMVQHYKAYYVWDEAELLYQTGSYEESCHSFSEATIPLQYTGTYLQYYGKALYLGEKYKQSLVMLEQAKRYTSDEVLFTTLGDIYKALKRYAEAEEAYRHASFMVPHKLYPRYLLAKLYAETGQNEKAIRTAEELLSVKIKVESEATEDIIQQMKDLIDNMKLLLKKGPTGEELNK